MISSFAHAAPSSQHFFSLNITNTLPRSLPCYYLCLEQSFPQILAKVLTFFRCLLKSQLFVKVISEHSISIFPTPSYALFHFTLLIPLWHLQPTSWNIFICMYVFLYFILSTKFKNLWRQRIIQLVLFSNPNTCLSAWN